MKKNKEVLALILLLILNISFISAEQNATIEQKVHDCIVQSRQALTKLENEGFSIQRINDSLKQAENLFNAQNILKEKNKDYDFSLVIPYCDEISKIKENALKSKDSLIALQWFYNESTEPGMNTNSVDILIEEIKSEIKNERYEKISPLIDKAYSQITNLKSSYSTLNIFYETTTANIGKFVDKNKYFIIIAIIFLIILFFIYKKTLFRWNLQRKIKNLDLRKKSLKDMIMNVQKSYFEQGKISEGEFNIKTKKLAELIRDIDRQIPLLQEELVKLSWKNF